MPMNTAGIIRGFLLVLLTLAGCATQPVAHSVKPRAPLRMGSAPQQSMTLTPPTGVVCPSSVPDQGLTTITMVAGACVFTAASGLHDSQGNPIPNRLLSSVAQRMIQGLVAQGWVVDGGGGGGITCSGCTANKVVKSDGTNLTTSDILDAAGLMTLAVNNLDLGLAPDNFVAIGVPNLVDATAVNIVAGYTSSGTPSGGTQFSLINFDTSGADGFACGSPLSATSQPNSCAFNHTVAGFYVGIDNLKNEAGTGPTNFVLGASYSKLSSAPASAPGAGKCATFVVAGTNSGSCKMQMQCGTSATPVTLLDNVGVGC
jgi:hypothetical protein